jgi:hypothetical protein
MLRLDLLDYFQSLVKPRLASQTRGRRLIMRPSAKHAYRSHRFGNRSTLRKSARQLAEASRQSGSTLTVARAGGGELLPQEDRACETVAGHLEPGPHPSARNWR